MGLAGVRAVVVGGGDGAEHEAARPHVLRGEAVRRRGGVVGEVALLERQRVGRVVGLAQSVRGVDLEVAAPLGVVGVGGEGGGELAGVVGDGEGLSRLEPLPQLGQGHRLRGEEGTWRAPEKDVVVPERRGERGLVGVQGHELAGCVGRLGGVLVLLPDLGSQPAREPVGAGLAVVGHGVEVEPGDVPGVVEDAVADPVEAVPGMRVQVAPVDALGRGLREDLHGVAAGSQDAGAGHRLEADDAGAAGGERNGPMAAPGVEAHGRRQRDVPLEDPKGHLVPELSDGVLVQVYRGEVEGGGLADDEGRGDAQPQRSGDAAVRGEGGLVRHGLEGAVAVRAHGGETRLGPRRDAGRAHAAAAAARVAVRHPDRVAGVQFALRDGYPHDEDIALHPPVEPGARRLHEEPWRLGLHLGGQPHPGPRRLGRDAVVSAGVGGLQPVRGVVQAGVPGVGKLHPQRAARAQAARSELVGHRPGAVVSGDAGRRLDPQPIALQ